MFHFILRILNSSVIKKILRIGLPSGFQYFFEVGAFSFAVIMVGWLGYETFSSSSNRNKSCFNIIYGSTWEYPLPEELESQMQWEGKV